MVEDTVTGRVWCNDCNAYHYAEVPPEVLARAMVPTTPELAARVDAETRPHVDLPASPAARLQALVDMYNGVPDDDGNLVKLISREQFIALAEMPDDPSHVDLTEHERTSGLYVPRGLSPWLPTGQPPTEPDPYVMNLYTDLLPRRVAGWLSDALDAATLAWVDAGCPRG